MSKNPIVKNQWELVWDYEDEREEYQKTSPNGSMGQILNYVDCCWWHIYDETGGVEIARGKTNSVELAMQRADKFL